MQIGIVCAGIVGKTIARHLVTAGHQVIISNYLGPESLGGVARELGPLAGAGTKQEAVESDLVILCVNCRQAEEALKGVTWSGRILVDATTAHSDDPPDISLEGVTGLRAALAKTGLILSEQAAEWAPGARVVKSISSMPMEWVKNLSDESAETGIHVIDMSFFPNWIGQTQIRRISLMPNRLTLTPVEPIHSDGRDVIPTLYQATSRTHPWATLRTHPPLLL